VAVGVFTVQAVGEEFGLGVAFGREAAAAVWAADDLVPVAPCLAVPDHHQFGRRGLGPGAGWARAGGGLHRWPRFAVAWSMTVR
jgi:hypothetical protein